MATFKSLLKAVNKSKCFMLTFWRGKILPLISKRNKNYLLKSTELTTTEPTRVQTGSFMKHWGADPEIHAGTARGVCRASCGCCAASLATSPGPRWPQSPGDITADWWQRAGAAWVPWDSAPSSMEIPDRCSGVSCRKHPGFLNCLWVRDAQNSAVLGY